jgi:hypothetical protein
MKDTDVDKMLCMVRSAVSDTYEEDVSPRAIGGNADERPESVC